jgi:preprotein translocase subunit SecE
MARTTRRRATVPTGPATQEPGEPRRVRENLPRPAAAPVASGVSRAPARKRRNPLAFLGRFEPRFIADIVAELRKVTWPTFAETRYLTVVVAIVAAVVGLFLGGVDLLFGWVIERIFF